MHAPPPQHDVLGTVRRLVELPEADRGPAFDELGLPPAGMLGALDLVRDQVMTDLEMATSGAGVLLDLSDRVGFVPARVRARTVLAHAMSYANRFGDALALLDEAVAIAGDGGHEDEAARAKLTRVQPLARQGRFEEAARDAADAAEIFERIGETGQLVRALTNGGVIERMTGRLHDACATFSRAIEACPEVATRAKIRSNRAEALLELGEYLEAEAEFRAAAEDLEDAGEERVGAIVRGNLADLLGRQGRFGQAFHEFEHARRFFERDDARGDLARLEAEFADVLSAAGLEDDAVMLYERAIGPLSETGLVAELARSTLGLGVLLIDTDPARAAGLLERAERGYGAMSHAHGLAAARLHRSALLLAMGQIRPARALLRSIGNPEDLPPHLRVLLLALRSRSSDAEDLGGEATRSLDEAIRLAGVSGLLGAHAPLLAERAALARAQGRPNDALADLDRAMEDIERARGMFRGDRIRAGFLGRHRPVFELAAALLLERGDAGSRERAFGVTERARSRALLDLLQGGVELSDQRAVDDDADGATRAAGSDPGGILERLSRARAELGQLYARLDPIDGLPAGEDHRAWSEEMRDREGRVNELEARLSATRSGYAMLGSPATPETIRQALGEDEILLDYAVVEDRLRVFVVRRWGDIRVVDLGEADRIDALAADASFQLRRAVGRPAGSGGFGARRTEAAHRALRVLSDAVLAPISELLTAPGSGDSAPARLSVIPTRGLHFVPFGALRADDEALIERAVVTRLPSAGVLASLAAQPSRVLSRSLAVGVSDPAAPGMEAEARDVAPWIPAPTVLVGPDATASALLGALPAADLVHIASHGVFTAGSPLSSAIRMRDRWVTVRELFGRARRGAAVVLSGCETGRVEVAHDEELYGLVRAFLAGGARCVLSSLWRADDRAARSLMGGMYERLPEKHPTTSDLIDALRCVQREFAARGVHPGLWAGFVAFGASS